MEYGDLFIYYTHGDARIGKYVRKTEDNKLAIVPMTNGSLVFRKREQVINLKLFLERNGYELKKTTNR